MKRSGRKGPKSAPSLPANEVDEFMERRERQQRDRIAATTTALRRAGVRGVAVNNVGDQSEDSDDAFGHDTHAYEDISDDDVMGLEVSTDEEDAESSEEETDSRSKTGGRRGRAADSDDENEDDEDEDDEDDEDEEIVTGKTSAAKLKAQLDRAEKSADANWGKKRQQYYGTDYAYEELDVNDADDKEHRKLEEEEATRLQRAQISTMSESDFGVEDLPLGKRASDSAKKSSTASSKSPAKSAKSAKSSAAAATDASVVVENVTRNVDALSRDERMKILKRESPELIRLLADLQTHLRELHTSVHPILDTVQPGPNSSVVTADGISYLELKFHLLLNYCLNICFYLLLKSEGGSVQSHPVIEHLVTLRTYLEKVRPLDQKIKYQVDKLLKLAASGSIDSSSVAAAAAAADANDINALRFKPQPSQLVSKLSGKLVIGTAKGAKDSSKNGKAGKTGKVVAESAADDVEVDDESEDHESSDVEDSGSKKPVYKIPKMVAVPYEDTNSAAEKKRKQEEKSKEKVRKSAVYQTLQEQFSDAPVEEASIGAIRARDIGSDVAAQAAFEEDHYFRKALNKKEKKDMARRKRDAELQFGGRALEDLADLGDLAMSEIHREAGGKSGAGGASASNPASGSSAWSSIATDLFTGPVVPAIKGQRTVVLDKSGSTVDGTSTTTTASVIAGDVDVPARPTLGERRSAFEDRRAAINAANADRRRKPVGAINDDHDDDGADLEDGLGDGAGSRSGGFGSGKRRGVADLVGGGGGDPLVSAKKARKEERRAAFEAQLDEIRAERKGAYRDEVGEDVGRREASAMILKNRGLTRYRKKEDRNPRVKLREKMRKAEIRRKGAVRDVRDKAMSYGGEETGIKANVSRSVRLTE